MAFANFVEQIYTLNRDVVFLPLRIPTNGATTPVAANILGRGAVVTRTGVGVYTVVFNAGLSFPNALCFDAHLQLSAVGATYAQVGTWVPSTRTLTINCTNGAGVAAEWPAANANNVLSVLAVFTNSNQVPVKG